MTPPLEFPDPVIEARRRAEEFQRLTPDQRIREMAALMAFGWAMVRTAPDREATERRMAEQEARWREIQRELFTHHDR